MRNKRVTVIGAGVGGLAAAIKLANAGLAVTVIERATRPGGKMREVVIDQGGAGFGQRQDKIGIDAGPTVLTMRWVFEQVFAEAGATLADYLTLRPAEVLARHAWSADERLDLYADIDRCAEAIAAFADPAEADRFRQFCAHARRVFTTLEQAFIQTPHPTPFSLVRDTRLADLMQIKPYTSLWRALGTFFHDQRLRQLFARYATYVGSSPFLSPATLMLVAHVELDGVWLVEGGMHRIPVALAELAGQCGVQLRYGTPVSAIEVAHDRVAGVTLANGEYLETDYVVCNADVAAVAAGRLGAKVAGKVRAPRPAERSLSALTWNLYAKTDGFPLLRHNVFFGRDYPTEFADILVRKQLPTEPTVYVCAQDRDDRDTRIKGPERLLCLVNAPAIGDISPFTKEQIEACGERTFALLERYGLRVERRPQTTVITKPSDFDRLFPASGGALYGRAAHGWRASFQRQGIASRLPGLYLAGGSVHPGPGVPMATISGRMAAQAILDDHQKARRL